MESDRQNVEVFMLLQKDSFVTIQKVSVMMDCAVQIVSTGQKVV